MYLFERTLKIAQWAELFPIDTQESFTCHSLGSWFIPKAFPYWSSPPQRVIRLFFNLRYFLENRKHLQKYGLQICWSDTIFLGPWRADWIINVRMGPFSPSQESLQLHRPDFISRSGERIKRLKLIIQERKLQNMLQSEREALFNTVREWQGYQDPICPLLKRGALFTCLLRGRGGKSLLAKEYCSMLSQLHTQEVTFCLLRQQKLPSLAVSTFMIQISDIYSCPVIAS